MFSLQTDGSPFLVLWYLFLVFFGTVVLVNLVVLVIRGILHIRIKQLAKQGSRRNG